MSGFFKQIPKVILILTWVDVLVISGFGLVMPVFAIFVTRQIEGGSATIVGIATAIYWLTKSILQMPVANYLDKNKGEKDDFYAMLFGYSILTIVPFMYLFASEPTHVFILQGLMGVGDAFGVPAYLAVFSRHINKFHESTEWTFRSIPIGLASAGTGALGGILADQFGFRLVFLITGALAFFALVSLTFIYPYLEKRKDMPFSVASHSIGWSKTRR